MAGVPLCRDWACPLARGREAIALAPGAEGRGGFHPQLLLGSVKEPDARPFRLRSAFEPLRGLNNKAGSVQTEQARKKRKAWQPGLGAGRQAHKATALGPRFFSMKIIGRNPLKEVPSSSRVWAL